MLAFWRVSFSQFATSCSLLPELISSEAAFWRAPGMEWILPYRGIFLFRVIARMARARRVYRVGCVFERGFSAPLFRAAGLSRPRRLGLSGSLPPDRQPTTAARFPFDCQITALARVARSAGRPPGQPVVRFGLFALFVKWPVVPKSSPNGGVALVWGAHAPPRVVLGASPSTSSLVPIE